jgi:hypothetical protein
MSYVQRHETRDGCSAVSFLARFCNHDGIAFDYGAACKGREITFWSQVGVLAQPIPRPFRYLLLATPCTAEQHYNHATSLVAARPHQQTIARLCREGHGRRRRRNREIDEHTL